jgi:hypothetical protein
MSSEIVLFVIFSYSHFIPSSMMSLNHMSVVCFTKYLMMPLESMLFLIHVHLYYIILLNLPNH